MVEDNRKITVDADENRDIELEEQFILRLPPTPASALRSAIRSDVSNLEDRLLIKIDRDMRHAAVQFDKWTLPAKLFDLPTIIESCKTSKRGIFCKTADICKIMVAQEGDAANRDEEVAGKKKGKDAKDKRYTYPHGITPPLKNVHKRRFRKTLKKKHVDWLNIEKEVKRLLRTDADAISVRYEICNSDRENAQLKHNEGIFGVEERELNNSQSADVAKCDIFDEVLSSSEERGEEYDVNVVDWLNVERDVKRLLQTDAAISVCYEVCNANCEKAQLKNNEGEIGIESLPVEERELNISQTADVAKCDTFGEVLSSSEERNEECNVNVIDVNGREAARNLQSIIEKQERIQEFYNMKGDKAVAELSTSIQLSLMTAEQFPDAEKNNSIVLSQLESETVVENLDLVAKEQKTEEEKMALMVKLRELEHTVANLQAKRKARESQITRIDNEALKHRFQANIDHLIQEECEKQQEYNDIMNILQEN